MRRFIILVIPLVLSYTPVEAAGHRFAGHRVAGHRFIVHVDASAASDESPQQLFERLGLRLVRRVRNDEQRVFVVEGDRGVPASVLREMLDAEPGIQQVESVRTLRLTRAAGGAAERARDRAASFARDQLATQRGSAYRRYRGQTLRRQLRLPAVHRYYTGAGVVAIIDTGVDPDHPALAGSLLRGFDFTLDRDGASEWTALDKELAAELQQSTVAVLDQSTVAVLDQSTVAVLDQFAILNQSTVAVLDQELFDRLASDDYRAFGHGTLIAGLVHLIAPEARILPLKAFRADGSSSTDDIVEAIYYAVAHGAGVINMSFSFETFSPEVMRAVNYATRNGVLCVSAAGNLGAPLLVYPASLANVTGVAAVTVNRERSSLSNYGEDLVSVAALGEDVLSTYPGGRYASVFGTSFSTAIVAGAMAILLDVDAGIDQYDAEAALAMGRPRSGDLGHGQLNLAGALMWLQRTRSQKDDER